MKHTASAHTTPNYIYNYCNLPVWYASIYVH